MTDMASEFKNGRRIAGQQQEVDAPRDRGDSKRQAVSAGAGAAVDKSAAGEEEDGDATEKKTTKEQPSEQQKKKKWTASTAGFVLDKEAQRLTDEKNVNAAALLAFVRDLAGMLGYKDVCMVWNRQTQGESPYAKLTTDKGFHANWFYHVQPQAAAQVKQALSAVHASQDSLLRLIKNKEAQPHLVNLIAMQAISVKPGQTAMPGTRVSTAAAFGRELTERRWFEEFLRV